VAYKINWKEITKQLGVERVELDGITNVIFYKSDGTTLIFENPKVVEYNAKGETHYQVSGKRVF
jgi:NACalpha-BTF3-like transcription factor